MAKKRLASGDTLVCVPCGAEYIISETGTAYAEAWCCGVPMKAAPGKRAAAPKKKATAAKKAPAKKTAPKKAAAKKTAGKKAPAKKR